MKFQVIIARASDGALVSLIVEALGFKSAYTAAVREWGGKGSDILEVKITRVPA